MTNVHTIECGQVSLVIRLPEFGMPEIIHLGPIAEEISAVTVHRASRVNGMDISVPSAVLLPVTGMGFFGWPAISGHRGGKDFTLQFQNWRIARDGNAHRLNAIDAVAGIEISILVTASQCSVLTTSTELTNRGNSSYTLDRCMAGSFLVSEGPGTITSLTGMWGREFQKRQAHLNPGIWLQENRRGRTSHDRYPTIATRVGSEEFVFHLGWSGNHVIAVDTLDDGRRLVHLGELFEPGEIQLGPGESYVSPTAYAAKRSEDLHSFVRTELITWPGGAMSERPVTLNTWEGNYFDHKIASLRSQADAAAELGIERFVLDDGWFGQRDDDTTSLGDWIVDRRKYPSGLRELANHVTNLGMQFGIWFEPEMVNPVSTLYREHPDWVLHVEGRPLLLSRNQLVLDLTRSEVSEYLFLTMSRLLAEQPISYIKWDMNRDLTHVGGTDGRPRTSAQTHAVYRLMDRIRSSFPRVEIESCASGGGRIDFGVLGRAQRVWTSDCTDAVDRLEIQRGASLLLPPEVLGAHISASPNHQTGRILSLSFRALVALGYHLGVELNPLELTAEEKNELKSWISLHKRLRPLLHGSDGASNFRQEPLDGRYVWGATRPDLAVAFVAQGPQMISEQPPPVKLALQGPAGRLWRIARVHPLTPEFVRTSQSQDDMLGGKVAFTAATIASVGLHLPMLRPESAMLLEFEALED
ncbi:alpha-galactosidase [Rhizobium sp. BK181]|uniref:alpha-galactosidase n=1 Tax=Rhizobium sp. BK181 TaxID=2587072 RepID=UPI00161975A5|nr:alpha-galactosidase [Rhizobium sp. BK181]MBB3320182.1 alpha-galactosidase [Rhizobium sp. BK181]